MKRSGISCYVKIWKWFIFERPRSKVKVKVEQNVKFTSLAITLHLIVIETSNLVHILLYENWHQIWPWPWKVHPRSKFLKYQLRKTSQNMLGYYAQGIIYCWRGQKGQAKGQIHLISYNFASNCHRDFKLGSCFSLWKAAPNMTVTLTSDLDLEKFTQSQNFWNIN